MIFVHGEFQENIRIYVMSKALKTH